jgi:hypothetical protein
MNYRGILVPLIAGALIVTSAAGYAAQANDDQPSMPQPQSQHDGQHAMQGGMMGGAMQGGAMQGGGMQGGGMQGGGMHGGMMGGGGMMGMMGGMGACGRTMGGASMSGAAMPQLPPGNEKLQLQMQAEMMQKMGEILAKYAARIDDRRGAH